MTAQIALQAGTMLGGHYRIEELINTGGFGSVYRGRAISEGNRPCAIKETYDVSPAARRQALMEAAILFTIKSEHLPEVYDAFEDNGRFYLVMQLIAGQNGAQIVKTRGRPCSEAEVMGWLLPVADVLQELHSRNPPVLHRDIKPANIIITPQGQAVLVDFGLTRLYDPDTQTQTMARAVSEGFSPLEQYIGQTSPQSDVYGLAATMYFLLTGQVPPAAVARSMDDRLNSVRQFNPQVSPQVDLVLKKAMSLNADQRFGSMQEFARAIRTPGYTISSMQTATPSRILAANDATQIGPISSPAAQGQVQLHLPPIQVMQATPLQAPPPPVSAPFTSAPVYPVRKPVTSRPVRPIPPPAGGAAGIPHPQVQQHARPEYHGPLPRAGNQGCLWGLLSGVTAALLIVFLQTQTAFYLALGTLLFCYMLAGYFTTHRGGSALRAIRAGWGAGIVSAVVFWIALPSGVLYLAVHRFNQLPDDNRPNVGRLYIRFFDQVMTVFPTLQTPVTVRDALIYVAVAIGCAIGFALVGGFLGAVRSGG